MSRMILAILIAAISSSPAFPQSMTLSEGKSSLTVTVREQPIEVFCYKPAAQQLDRLIVVMHGVNRNADEYRDDAISMGDRFSALIVAPKFDMQRFPGVKYNRGGVLTEDNRPVPESEWTYQYLSELITHLKQLEGRPNMPFWVIGHSAGGQFVARMSALFNIGAERLVAANPGTQIFPTKDAPFGYGLGGLPNEWSIDQRIQQYLATPLTIYLGTADDHHDEFLDDSREAMQQGPGRYQRGRACYEYAKQLAEQNQWPFEWQLIEADGVAHSHREMFDHPQCQLALFGAAQ